MTDSRQDDAEESRSWFRTDRLVEEGGSWYFLTREGTVEGPFDSRIEAIERIDLYAKVMNANLLSAESEAELKV